MTEFGFKEFLEGVQLVLEGALDGVAGGGGDEAQWLTAGAHGGAHDVEQITHVTAVLDIGGGAVLIAINYLGKEAVLFLAAGTEGDGITGSGLKGFPVDLGGCHADALALWVEVAEQLLEFLKEDLALVLAVGAHGELTVVITQKHEHEDIDYGGKPRFAYLTGAKEGEVCDEAAAVIDKAVFWVDLLSV